MLTYSSPLEPGDPLAELNTKLPDIIESGETDTYWVHVSRSAQMIMVMSKQTGELIYRCKAEDALAYGLSERQLAFAKAALKL